MNRQRKYKWTWRRAAKIVCIKIYQDSSTYDLPQHPNLVFCANDIELLSYRAFESYKVCTVFVCSHTLFCTHICWIEVLDSDRKPTLICILVNYLNQRKGRCLPVWTYAVLLLTSSFCFLVCFEFYIPLENFSLLWRCHNYQWRA